MDSDQSRKVSPHTNHVISKDGSRQLCHLILKAQDDVLDGDCLDGVAGREVLEGHRDGVLDENLVRIRKGKGDELLSRDQNDENPKEL